MALITLSENKAFNGLSSGACLIKICNGIVKTYLFYIDFNSQFCFLDTFVTSTCPVCGFKVNERSQGAGLSICFEVKERL